MRFWKDVATRAIESHATTMRMVAVFLKRAAEQIEAGEPEQAAQTMRDVAAIIGERVPAPGEVVSWP